MNSDVILQTLGRLSLEASALIAVVLLLRWLMGPKLTAGWRVLLWALVALKLVLPAMLPVGFGIGQTEDVAKTVADVVVVERSVGSEQTAEEPTPWLLALWLLGAVVVVTVASFRHWRFMRKLERTATLGHAADIIEAAKQAGLHRLPRVLVSREAVVPSVAGLLRPTLILPRQQVQHQVILHELFHLKHQDIAVNWAWVLLQAVHWFNPLVWLAASRCQEDRELRCDEAALCCSSQAERIAYGRELIRLQENFIAPPALAGVAACVRNHPPLRQRILMITHPTTNHPWAKYALTLLTLGLASIFFGTAQAEEEKSRTREGERSTRTPASGERGEEVRKPAAGEGGEGEKPAMGEREGERGKPREGGDRGKREGEGADRGKREGEGDREGAKTGPRDGDKPRTGPKDGEGESRRGPRDGEGERSGPRDGEGGKSAEGGDRKAAAGEPIVLRVINGGEQVQIGGSKVAISRLRGHLQGFLPRTGGAPVVIQADDDVPFKIVAEVLDAARDNGARGASIQTISPTPTRKGSGPVEIPPTR